LRFWVKELGFDGEISFAPYNQTFQQLLDPGSLLGQNQGGLNLILVRIEDWTRFRAGALDEEVLRQGAEELASALGSFARRCPAPTLVWVAPPSPASGGNAGLIGVVSALRERVRQAVEGLESLHWLGDEALEPYPVSRVEDSKRDAIGHIPYTPAFFTALASAVARRIHGLRTNPYKVLALDCDNTLWQGVVGEEGPLGVTLPPGKRALQEFVVYLQKRGMLICLVSKNIEADVFAVLEKRTDMPVRRDHLVGWRVNWQPKSRNIAELAAELNLGRDSFIFLDDNPVECAEMRAALPEVLTLQLPQEDSEIPDFLRHVWAFDRRTSTEEDRQRTQMYQQNAERRRFEQQAGTVEEFLAGLRLVIDMGAPAREQWPRVAQLTQRTNQFNFTTIRRTETELLRLSEVGFECLRIEVSDRFGDYGLVGVLIFKTQGDTLRIDTMLLSCRVLGRGVEHAMLAHLGRLAVERGLSWLEARFERTAKNQPAADFLEACGAAYRLQVDAGVLYRFPAAVAAAVAYRPAQDSAKELPRNEEGGRDGTGKSAQQFYPETSSFYERVATQLRSVEAVLCASEAAALGSRPEIPTPYVEPQTAVQRGLAGLWARLLRLDRVGLHDDFTALGGSSLVAANLFAEIDERFGVRLPMTTILEASTVELLAARLGGGERVSLRLLKPGLDGGPTLFLVHDGDGETLLYLNLARRMPEEVAVYGIEPHGTDRFPILHTRIPEMAAHYVGRIQQVYPDGPYALAGMCAGGVIAFEMALQLRAEGLPVSFVGLLDSAAPGAERRKGLISRRRGARFLQAFQGTQAPTVLGRVAARLSRASTKIYNLLRYEFQTRRRKLIERARFLLLRRAIDRKGTLPRRLQGLSVRTVYDFAEREYRPARGLDAPVFLFRASQGEGADEPFANLFTDPLLWWGTYMDGGPELIEVAGGHASMLQEPHAEGFAESMKAALNFGCAAEVAP
jgi:FkbH-like protein